MTHDPFFIFMDHGTWIMDHLRLDSPSEPSGASGGKLPSDGGRAQPPFFTKLFQIVLLSRRTMMAKAWFVIGASRPFGAKNAFEEAHADEPVRDADRRTAARDVEIIP
jgi:hypothetical protein